MCLERKKKGKSKVLSRGFCLLESGAAWQLFHLSPKYPRVIMPSAQILN